jgi:2-amino-4-hydroxy-6-hydroxymethyldihydropteridine diphosphokinase
MKEKVHLTLGSNMDKEYYYPRAVRKLAEIAEVVAVSPVYETQPIGMEEGAGTFFNGAVLVVTDLEPDAFKRRLVEDLETVLDRTRPAGRQWVSRTIDVDIAIWGEFVGEILGRRVPDPDIQRHLHVALPLADITPDLELPGQEGPEPLTLKQIAENLAKGRPLPPRRDDIILKI